METPDFKNVFFPEGKVLVEWCQITHNAASFRTFLLLLQYFSFLKFQAHIHDFTQLQEFLNYV